MDNGSRNIVTFIATITGAILLFMGAQFWAQSPELSAEPNMPKEVGKQPSQISATEPELAETEEPSDPLASDEFAEPDENVDLEAPDRITGEPSLKIESSTESVATEG